LKLNDSTVNKQFLMVNKKWCVIAFLFLFSFTFIAAYTSYENIPASVDLKCGQTYSEVFNFTEEVNYTLETQDIYLGYFLGLTKTSSNYLQISLFPKNDYSCVSGNGDFDFTVNDKSYTLTLNITEDMWSLGNYSIEQGQSLSVGSLANFELITTSEGKIRYKLDGCSKDIDDFLMIGDSYSLSCGDEIIRFELASADEAPFSFAKINIYSTESAFNVVVNEDIDSSECVLGLDTLGAKVKRGNLFAIKTININNNKAISGVSVTIIDQEGELSPLNGMSSNTGFFNERLHAEYGQDLIVELQKEGCEPSTQTILFENTYNDYLKEKELEENKFSLKIVIENDSLEGVVTNLLNEVVEDANVKMTNPEGISKELTTDKDGKFSFDKEGSGIYKLQVGKDNYQSSELMELDLSSKEYAVAFFVDGQEKSRLNKGDIVTIKILDQENNVIPLTIDAEIDDDLIQFTNGISQPYAFKGDVELVIPETGNYEEEDFRLRKVDNNYLTYLWIALGIIAFIAIIFGISKAPKSSKGSDSMNIVLEPKD